jgi:23S rRNA-/tRNA-specific pseudouridylate synthase
VRPGQRIELIEPEGGTPAFYMMQLHVVYEDGHLAVINKPPGVAVTAIFLKPSSTRSAATSPHRVSLTR